MSPKLKLGLVYEERRARGNNTDRNEPSPLNLQKCLKSSSELAPRVFQFHSMQIPRNKETDWHGTTSQASDQIDEISPENLSSTLPVIAPSASTFPNQGLFYVATDSGLILVPSFATAPSINGGRYSVEVSQLTDQHGQFLFPLDPKSIAVTSTDHETHNAKQKKQSKDSYQMTSLSAYLHNNDLSKEITNSGHVMPDSPQEVPLNLSMSTNTQRSRQSNGSSDLKEVLNVPSPRTSIPQAQTLHGYECTECGKTYSTSSNLARHRQTHRSVNDQKARKCPHCDKVYVSMPALSMHI
ncbi:putative zinc finger protein, partial [Apostichopus japonicus]